MVVHGRPLIAAMAVRAELAGRREMEGLGLGHVDESVGVLTVEGICEEPSKLNPFNRVIIH